MSAMSPQNLRAVAVQRREERRRLERGVAGVAELLGGTGERGVRRVRLLQAGLQAAAGGRGDPALDSEALLDGLPGLRGVEFDAVRRAVGAAVRVPEVQVPRTDLV